MVAGGADYGGKPRPAAVVQEDRFDATLSITVCACTTDPARGTMTSGAVFTGNNELALHVGDPVAASTFYVNVMGCRLIDSNPQCVELTSGALRLFLLPDAEPTHERLVPSFSVPDRAAALATLQRAGCTLIPIGPHAPGDHYVRDPNGVLFDVIERS